MRFLDPAVFLMALPVLLALAVAILRPRHSAASPLAIYHRQGPGWRAGLWWLPELIQAVMVLTVVWLLAGPLEPPPPGIQEGQGLSIAIVLDRSSSMGVMIPKEQGLITRLDGVKELCRAFLASRPDDQFAILSFARYPETHSPLSSRKAVLEGFLDLIHLASKDEDGTAMGDAIALADARLPADQDKGKVLIVLTDGQNNAGTQSPLEAASQAQAHGTRVYTIGLGGEGYLTEDSALGRRTLRVPVNLDDRALEQVAKAGGGSYFRADSLEDLSVLFEEIAKMETQRLATPKELPGILHLEPGLWLLAALILLLPLGRDLILGRVHR